MQAFERARLHVAPLEPRAYFLLKADTGLDDAVLRSLAAGTADPEPSEVARALETSLGRAPARIASIGRAGTFHWVRAAELDDGSRVVIRGSRLEQHDLGPRFEREAEVIRTVAAAGLRCARCLVVDASRSRVPFQFAIYEQLDGATLAERDADEQATSEVLEQLGQYLARLHTLQVPGCGPLRDDAHEFERWMDFIQCRWTDHVQMCERSGAIDARQAERARRWSSSFATLEAPTSNRLLHGDPGPHNVICRGGELRGLIDWEDALAGDPLFDLASCASFEPERRWPHLLRGYFGREVRADALHPNFWLYFLRIAVARMVVRQRLGLRDQPGRSPAVARIGRALDALERTRGAS